MRTPHVVIVVGGFGGLAVARTLAKAPVNITLVDRRNHHVFQPLLYQVATAELNPSDIAYPIRASLVKQRNVRVLLAEAKSIDVAQRRITLDDGLLDFDYMIVATGAKHSYFGKDEWATHAPGLKSIEDALEIRRRISSVRGCRAPGFITARSQGLEFEAERKPHRVTRQDQVAPVDGSEEEPDRGPLGAVRRGGEPDVDSLLGDGDLAGCGEDVRKDLLRLARPAQV